MPTVPERNAAFNAVKPHVMALIPAWAHAYVSDEVILNLCDAALNAAEAVRNKAAKP